MYKPVPLVQLKNGYNVKSVQKFENLSLEPRSDAEVELVSDNLLEPIVKEEEVITKSTTELTTTRQIATRIKRQVVLEDGKIVDDSGPIIETNTTEDTDKKTSQETERRTLGDDADPKQKALQAKNLISATNEKGLYRAVEEQTIISRKEQTDIKEVEDVRHLGDFSDKAFVDVINSGVRDIEKALYSPEVQRQLIPRGPQLLYEKTKTFETIDTEEKDLKYIVRPDGTLVTEEKKTTAHEEIRDEELPDDKELLMGPNETRIDHESSQRFSKQQDKQEIEYLANGKVIAKETKYANESEKMERDGPKEEPGDWDSLSDRLRKARRQQKFVLNKNLGANEPAIIPNKDDNMKKITIDYDTEEETRRTETNKWLESHFGSESRSSKDSLVDEDVVVKPTKKTFFNVTIKSNNQSANVNSESKMFDTRTTVNKYPEVVPIRVETRPSPKEFIYESKTRTRTPPFRSPSEEHRFVSSKREERYHDIHKHNVDDIPQPKPVFQLGKAFVSPVKSEVYQRNSEESSSKYTSNEPQYVVGSNYSLSSNSRRTHHVTHETTNGTLTRNDPYKKSPRYGDSPWIDVHNELLAKANAPRPIAPVFQKFSSTNNISHISNLRSSSPYNKYAARHLSDSDPYPVAPPRKRGSQKKSMDLTAEEDYSSVPRSRSVSPTARYRLKPKTEKQQVLDKKKRAESVDAINPKREFKVGSAIGNTFRKLIGKIRSASSERKLKTKSRSRTSSPQKENKSPLNSTYHSYQYSNNVDGHIDNDRYQSTLNREHRKRYNDDTLQKSSKYNGDMSSSAGTAKQRYYMGENPYQATMYGKEDIYDTRPLRDDPRSAKQIIYSQTRSSSVTPYKQNGVQHAEDNGLYRGSQTLPRKLKNESRKQSASTMNVSTVNIKPTLIAGPAKPIRMKALNRSQSFNVNGINGSVNHHYQQQQQRYEKPVGTPTKSFQQMSSSFKSNPNLDYGADQLQSPSIVSLISRSQRDLSSIPRNETTLNNKFLRYPS